MARTTGWGEQRVELKIERNGSVGARLTSSWRANRRKLSLRLAVANVLAALLPHDMFNHRRAAFYRSAGMQIGAGTQILGPLTLLGWESIPEFVVIGSECALETPCTISAAARVHIGDRVNMGPEVMILTGSHKLGGIERRCGAYAFAPVEIGDGSWIGARVTILPGVTIGPGCVISAGSVVTRSMPAHSMVAGNPARVIGKLDESTPVSLEEAH
jgi:maltose O-acetyltransferase